VPELLNDEIATLLRERLDARQPRRLPVRFVPPAERPHRVRWAIAVAAAFLLGLAIATLLQPGVGQIVRSGLLDRPGSTPEPTVTAPGRPGVTQVPGVAPAPSASPSQTPAPQPSGADGSGSSGSAGGTPPPPPAGDTITLPLPPLPLPTPSGGIPLPVPSLPLPPLPLPTPSGGGLPPLLPTPH